MRSNARSATGTACKYRAPGCKILQRICSTLILISLLQIVLNSCKRYEKLPIAVLREAEPYDFGGIDIIDELPLPTVRSARERDKAEAEDAKQSTLPEPSLTNVVTAAEDFIKVLATVSSSTGDSDKGESQSSEKNKKKSGGKKKKERKKTGKKPKGKGKRRRRKQKVEETAVSTTPAGGAEEVKALSNFISESRNKKAEVVDGGAGGLELGREQKPSNEVMKDEPAVEKETASTSPLEQKKQESAVSTTTAAGPRRVRPKQWGRGWRSKGEAKLPPLSKAGPDATDTPVPARTPAAKSQERLGSGVDGEKVKQSRSKGRRMKDGGKKRRKDSGGGGGASPTVPLTPTDRSFSVGYLESIPVTGTPTVVTLLHRQGAHRGRPNAGGRGGGGAPNSSLSRTEPRKPQKKRLKGGEGKRGPLLPPSAESSSPTVETAVTEWRLYAAATLAPSVTAETRTQIVGQQRRKSRRKKKKDKPSSASAPVAPQHFRQTPARSRVPLAKQIRATDKTPDAATTSVAPTMSPRQLSIERVKAQFSRKKRRKEALSRGRA